MLGDGVDLLFCNDAEATSYTDTDSPEAALEKLKTVCRSAVITLGAKGALVWDGEQTHHIDPVPVKAIDSNGAGDMFAGAFLYAITHGHDFAAAGKLASAAAARLVTEFGPRLSADVHQEMRQTVLGD
jgi:sugar/nucleoside kinase (ribokinase family)